MELRCSRILAHWLGAIEPQTPAEHRDLKTRDMMLVRAIEDGVAMFWPVAKGLAAVMRQFK